MKKDKKENKQNIINGDVNINDNSINNNVYIKVGYGQEDMTLISKQAIINALQSGYNAALKLTETVHFNPDYPQFHNVYISNMKDKYAMCHDGNKWNLIIKEDLINQIYSDKKSYIDDNFDKFVDSLQPSKKRALRRWLETDENDNDDVENEDVRKRIISIKNEIKLLLYNKRDLIENNKKDKKVLKMLKEKE